MDMTMVFTDIGYTTSRVAVTAIVSWLGCLGIGLLMHKFRLVNLICLPVVNFLRQISPFVWLPFAIILFGLGELPIGVVLITAMFFPGVIMMFEAIGSFPKDVYEEAITAGAHSHQLFFRIELPMLWNQLINIFRLLWSVGWSTVIAAEMLGVSKGLGFRLLDFRYLLEYKSMLLYIIIIGLIGIMSDRLFRRLLTLKY
jgi:NitT/TauT family transport system permease protein